MALPGKRIQDQLPRLKECVENWQEYFSENNERFHRSKKFVFKNTLSDSDKAKLVALGMPTLQFNVLEGYVSRLRGEFAIVEPQIGVQSRDENNDDAPMIKTVTAIVRSILYHSQSQDVDNQIYKDILVGGFSVMKVYTDYVDDHSIEQDVFLGTTFDPTLCGFDPYARKPHKGDGNYCYELFPLYTKDFKAQYPNVDYSELSFVKDNGVFNWSYTSAKQKEILFVCDFFEKKKRTVTFYCVTTPSQQDPTETYQQYLTEKQFEQYISGLVIPPEEGQYKVMKREAFDIYRYRFMGDKVLEYEKTAFTQLPRIFVDGNSETIEQKQMTRGYVYNAMDAQRARNLSGNSLLDEIQNMRKTTIIAPERSLPTSPADRELWENPQRTSAALPYRDIDPLTNMPIPSPQVFPRAPIPPELFQFFNGSIQAIQSALGAYNPATGAGENNSSGVAIIKSTTNSNAAAKPYMMNYISAMNQASRAIIDIIPIYYTTPRTVPLRAPDGSRTFQKINDPNNQNSVMLRYAPNELNVYVEEGVNFEIQKQESVTTLLGLSQQLSTLQSILNGPGLPIVLENLDIKGIEELREVSAEFLKQQQAQQQSQGNQPDPTTIALQLEGQKVQIEGQKAQSENEYKQSSLQIEQQKVSGDQQLKQLQLMLDYRVAVAKLQTAQSAQDTENARTEIDRLEIAIDQWKFMVNKNHELHKDSVASSNAGVQL